MKFLRFILLPPVFLFTISLTGLAQATNENPIDSLKRVIADCKDDTNKTKLLNKLGFELRSQNVDSSIVFANSALVLSKKLNYNPGIVASYSQLAAAYSLQGKFFEELKCWEGKLKIHLSNIENKEASVTYLRMGNIFYNTGKYPQALSYYYNGLKLSEELKDSLGISWAYHNLGNVHEKLKNEKEALKFYFDALEIEKNLGEDLSVAYTYAAIGSIYFGNKKYDEALKYQMLGQDLCIKLDDKRGIYEGEIQIGTTLLYQEKYDEALKHLFSAIKYSDSISDESRSPIINEQIALVYINQKKFSLASKYINDALTQAKQNNSLEDLTSIYGTYSLLDSMQGNHSQALMYYKLSIAYRDSMFNNDNTRQLVQSEMQYEFGKKELADSLQHAQEIAIGKAEVKQQRTILLISILLALFIIAFIIYHQRSKIAKERVKQQHEFARQLLEIELKALRAQMNPHFIFNCLNSIQAYILREDKTEATAFLQKFSKLIRLILDNSQKTSNTIEDEVEIINLYLQLEQLRLKNKFDFKIEVDESINKLETEIPSMVIQPIVENSIWHGLMHLQEKGMLKIKISNQDGNLKCIVEDNGIGREKSMQMKSEKVSMHESKGMKLIQDRLKAWSETKGLQFSFNINDLKGAITGTQTEIIIQNAVYA